jgi:hypothetical protein
MREGTALMTIVETRLVCGGVDTHSLIHVAAVIDANGGLLGVEEFEVSRAGYDKLLDWLRDHARSSASGSKAQGHMARTWRAISLSTTSRWSRLIGLIASSVPGRASPIQSTPSQQRERRCRAERRASPRAATATWKPSAC